MLEFCLECHSKWDPTFDVPECDDEDHEHVQLFNDGEEFEEETDA